MTGDANTESPVDASEDPIDPRPASEAQDESPESYDKVANRAVDLVDEQDILRKRALTLARTPEGAIESKGGLEVVEFYLANERYGIEAAHVKGVYPMSDVTPIPCTPSFVLGILRVRGQIISIIDLRDFFDLPKQEITEETKVVALQSMRMELGLLADSVLAVRTVPLSDLQPELPTLTGVRKDYLRAVTKDRLVILDAKNLLNDERIVVNETV